MNFSPAVIFFDLDGTLVDDAAAVETALKRLHTVVGAEPGMSLHALVSRWQELLNVYYERYLSGDISMQEQRRARIRGLFEHRSATMADAETDVIFAIYEKYYRLAWKAFSDVVPTLAALASLRLAVLTNGDLNQQNEKLRAAELDQYFTRVFASSQLGFRKPHPESFLRSCSDLGAEPARCLHVEDSLDIDVCGSRAAGLQSIWLDRLGTANVSHAGIRVIHSLTEIPSLLSATDELRCSP